MDLFMLRLMGLVLMYLASFLIPCCIMEVQTKNSQEADLHLHSGNLT